MSKLEIVYAMGDRELGYRCLKLLESNDVLPKLFLFPKLGSNTFVNRVKEEHPRVPCIDGTGFRADDKLSMIRDINPDYIVSILYPYIFKDPIFDYVKVGVLNLHPSYLPYNKGWHSCSWSIIDNTPIGCTLHWIDRGIDTGNICFQKKLDTKPHFTADTIYREISLLEFELFREALPFIIDKRLPSIPQKEAGTMHYKDDLREAQQLDMDERDSIGHVIDRLRALTTNDTNESAYFLKGNKKYSVQVSIKETR